MTHIFLSVFLCCYLCDTGSVSSSRTGSMPWQLVSWLGWQSLGKISPVLVVFPLCDSFHSKETSQRDTKMNSPDDELEIEGPGMRSPTPAVAHSNIQVLPKPESYA